MAHAGRMRSAAAKATIRCAAVHQASKARPNLSRAAFEFPSCALPTFSAGLVRSVFPGCATSLVWVPRIALLVNAALTPVASRSAIPMVTAWSVKFARKDYASLDAPRIQTVLWDKFV